MAGRPRETLLDAEGVTAAVEALAARIAPEIDDDWVVVCLLTGGLWFASDLTRALARLGRHPRFDALWLASYGDGVRSGGEVEVRAAMQRPVEGSAVLLVDDVLETGLSLEHAARLVREAGALTVATAVFARKPWEGRRAEADHVAWEAPARFLVGYGMDLAGRYRGSPRIEAAD